MVRIAQTAKTGKTIKASVAKQPVRTMPKASPRRDTQRDDDFARKWDAFLSTELDEDTPEHRANNNKGGEADDSATAELLAEQSRLRKEQSAT